MKRIVIYIVFIALLASCTQNDGRIGSIFGKWQLREIQIGDNNVACDHVFYSFQSNIVQLRRLHSDYGVEWFTGFFTHTDDELLLEIKNCNNKWYIREFFFLPDTTVLFKVEELDGKKMTLRDSDNVIYRLRRFGP